MAKQKTTFTVTAADVQKVLTLVESRRSDKLFLEREQRNVHGPAPCFDREWFWQVLLGCLLTTRQKSTEGKPVDRFLKLKPFPLGLDKCSDDIEDVIITTLTAFRGIRMAPTIARRAKLNYEKLNLGEWASVETQFQKLASQRNRPPRRDDITIERQAAHFAGDLFVGIGPKQSRNLWQWLGLTRYEIPLDSRVCEWINNNLSEEIDVSRLSNHRYYDSVLNYLQSLCDQAGALPCIFDAAAFDYEEKGTTSEALMSRSSKGTTKIGYINENGQMVIRDTGESGTDYGARKFQLACSRCGHNYGANSTDIWERKCPNCQGGAEGLPLKMGAHA